MPKRSIYIYIYYLRKNSKKLLWLLSFWSILLPFVAATISDAACQICRKILMISAHWRQRRSCQTRYTRPQTSQVNENKSKSSESAKVANGSLIRCGNSSQHPAAPAIHPYSHPLSEKRWPRDGSTNRYVIISFWPTLEAGPNSFALPCLALPYDSVRKLCALGIFLLLFECIFGVRCGSLFCNFSLFILLVLERFLVVSISGFIDLFIVS